MLGDEVAGQIVEAAAMKFRFAKVSAKKRLVIVPRHEANLTAVDLVGNLQA